MEVAVDFGTEYTKVAYLDEDNQIKLFSLGAKGDQAYIPTAVAYYTDRGQDRIAIGKKALDTASQRRNVAVCEGFKLLLPVPPEDWQRYGWDGSRSPIDVTRDFFRNLLVEGDYSFMRQRGKITRLIVSVPEVWQRSSSNRGAEALLQVLKQDLQLPVDSLRSEPICAAAYYFYRHQEMAKQEGPLTLLINDVGGGTFDVALCRSEGGDHPVIKVLDFDGNGQDGHGLAGALFDRRVVSAVYASVNNGVTLAPDSAEFAKLQRQFEDAKITQHEEVRDGFSSGLYDSLPGDLTVYRFDEERFLVTKDMVLGAFTPIKEGITSVLDRMKARARDLDVTIDRIAVVGGFGQFELVRQTVFHELDVDQPATDDRCREILNAEEQVNAVVFGAAHLLRGDFVAKEYYPHSLALRLYATQNALMQEQRVKLCDYDQVEAGSVQPIYAQLADDKPAIITVHVSGLTQLPLECRLKGSQDWLQMKLPPADLPPPGAYRVGFVVDRSNLGTLIFEPWSNGQPVVGGEALYIRLGDVKFALTAGGKA